MYVVCLSVFPPVWSTIALLVSASPVAAVVPYTRAVCCVVPSKQYNHNNSHLSYLLRRVFTTLHDDCSKCRLPGAVITRFETCDRAILSLYEQPSHRLVNPTLECPCLPCLTIINPFFFHVSSSVRSYFYTSSSISLLLRMYVAGRFSVISFRHTRCVTTLLVMIPERFRFVTFCYFSIT